MKYIYHDSERFRAQLFLFLGTALSTPLSILILEKMKTNNNFESIYWQISIMLALVGLTAILFSYTIIVNKDEISNGK